MEQAKTELDSLSKRFLTELERMVPRSNFQTDFTDRFIVTIPARDIEVGDITVWLEGEITVTVAALSLL
jgi:hypothetical protein